jgi:hypothetical protein
VSWHLRGRQQNHCPPEFQDRLTRVGGRNRYGQPNFLLVWGECSTYRAGGYWPLDGTQGYRDIPRLNVPGWLILQWFPPEVYGTPTSHYIENRDDATGLQDLGEYPYQGKYEVLFTLVNREKRGGFLKVEILPLSNFLLDTVIPIVLQAGRVSKQKQRDAVKELKARDEAAKLEFITQARLNARLAFGGAAFAGRNGRSSTLIDRKMAEIEQYGRQALNQMRRAGKGTSIMHR